MKMILAILHDSDSELVSRALLDSNFRVTRVASTGGFLRHGSTTLMIGVENEKVDEALRLIRENVGPPSEPNLKRATLFVLPVEHFVQV
jgi:uncharacterized protein YaaQ